MYGHGHGPPDPARVRWRFQTTAPVPKLLPLAGGLSADVSVETDARSRLARTLNHLLKVFLIDNHLWVRARFTACQRWMWRRW